MLFRETVLASSLLALASAACGPNRSFDDSGPFPDVVDAPVDTGLDVAMDTRPDVATDQPVDTRSDTIDVVAADTPMADAFNDGPRDVAPDLPLDVAADVVPDAPLPDVITDAADPCFGLDIRPDLNANSVPDCRETLVANSQFPISVAPWVSTTRATIAWTATDALSFPTSGSALVTDIVAATTVNGGSVDGECVPVSPSANYGIYTQYFMASGQPGGDAANATWITVQTYLDSGCTMPNAGISGGTLGSTKDAWAIYSRHITTASTEHSLRLSLGVLKGATTSPVSASFDNVLLVRE